MPFGYAAFNALASCQRRDNAYAVVPDRDGGRRSWRGKRLSDRGAKLRDRQRGLSSCPWERSVAVTSSPGLTLDASRADHEPFTVGSARQQFDHETLN